MYSPKQMCVKARELKLHTNKYLSNLKVASSLSKKRRLEEMKQRQDKEKAKANL